MKNLKTTILKSCVIVLGMQPIVSNAQWTRDPVNGYTYTTTSTDKVGIGTSTPADKLQVDPNGFGGITIGSTVSGKTALVLNISQASGGYSIINSVKSQGSAYGDLVLNQTDGNVGIGMSPNASYKLDINGSLRSKFINVANSSGTVYLGYSQLAAITYAASGPNTTWFHTYNDNNGFLKFSIGATPTTSGALLSLHTSGTVTIAGALTVGTTKPTGLNPGTDFMLAVAGKIYAQEVNVTPSSNWSDYVFKSDYKLAPLTDVAKYIKENGHLENVPSAADVAKNGFKLGEMDATLLRKIEELTLYMLEQEKKNIAQQKEIENLRALISK